MRSWALRASVFSGVTNWKEPSDESLPIDLSDLSAALSAWVSASSCSSSPSVSDSTSRNGFLRSIDESRESLE